MRRIVTKPFTTLLAAIYVCMTTFTTANAEGEKKSCRNDDTIHLGNITDNLYRHNMVFLEDIALENYLNTIVAKLEDIPAQTGNYNVKVVNDSILNSYSSPVGTIYITTGLIGSLKNEKELAFILGHEMAHIDSCSQFNEYSTIKTRRQAIIIGGSVLAVAVVVATVGMAAAAAGPMGTATSSSTMISSIGANVAGVSFSQSMSSGKINFAKVPMGKSGIPTEHDQHPVDFPAIFGSVIKGAYEGYGIEEEKKANEFSIHLLSKAGYLDEGQKLLLDIPDASYKDTVTHLKSYLTAEGI